MARAFSPATVRELTGQVVALAHEIVDIVIDRALMAVGYGGPGPRYCVGAHLARCEISAMIGVLFERMPGLEVTGEPEWLCSSSINGIKHLPVRYSPGRKWAGA